MSRLKRITMSHLPLEQTPVSAKELFDNVKLDMEAFGHHIDSNDFLQTLFSLRDEQALVFFGDKRDKPVIATQYGFRIYGTD